MLRVPGTQILHKTTNEGFLVSDDNGLNWHYTFRGEDEFKQMHKTAVKIPEVGDLVRVVKPTTQNGEGLHWNPDMDTCNGKIGKVSEINLVYQQGNIKIEGFVDETGYQWHFDYDWLQFVNQEKLEDEEREIFGETIDEPLPEDFVL